MEANWPYDPWETPLASHHSNPRPIVPAATSNRHAVRVRGTPEPIALHGSDLPGDWTDEALCKGMDTDLFFPRRGQVQTEVKEVCDRCPVQAECREYSLGVGALLQGIWGGQNERQRRKARTDRARELAEVEEAELVVIVVITTAVPVTDEKKKSA